jgi:HlyD family secretion protein
VKKALIVVIAIVVVGGIAAAVVGSRLLKQRGASAKVSLGAVERTDLTAVVSAPGRVSPATSVNLSAEVPGRIMELAVEEGDRVEKGQLLLRLDDARYRSAVAQATASLASSRANLTLSRARLEKAEKDVARYEGLARNELTSVSALEAAQTDRRVYAAEVEARQEEVKRAEATLEVARDDLAKTVYRAPLDGVISRLNVEEGENVVVGTMNNPGTVILTVANLGVMEVEAEVSETDVIRVDVGQPVEISVDALRDETFAGTVVAVGNSGRTTGSGTVDAATHFQVRVQFDAVERRLRPGMTADVDIRTETREGVLTVPIQALVARSRGTLLDARKTAKLDPGPREAPEEMEGDDLDQWRKEVVEGVYLRRDGVADFVELTTGIAGDTRIEAEGELAEGDELVTGPFRVLRTLAEGTRLKERQGGEN